MEPHVVQRLQTAQDHLQRLRNEATRALGALRVDMAARPGTGLALRQTLQGILDHATAALRDIELVDREERERHEAIAMTAPIAVPAGAAIPRIELIDCAWYFGHGRLGNVAQWFAQERRFAVATRDMGALVAAEMDYDRGFTPRLRLT